jgi:DNA polymerase-4
VIQPHEVQPFLLPLPIGRIPGVGRVTEARIAQVGIKTVGDVFGAERGALEEQFGRWGTRLYQLARGIDHNPVVPNRIRKQISAEDTFPEDIPLTACVPHIRRLAEKVWAALGDNARGARTVGLKLKTAEFQSIARSLTLPVPLATCDDLIETAILLCERVHLKSEQLYRLVGVGLSNFLDEAGTLSPLFGN